MTNTLFCKPRGELWTFLSPHGLRYQLDYVLVISKWHNSALNAEAYSTFASVGSDHRRVTAKIRLTENSSMTGNHLPAIVIFKNMHQALQSESQTASDRYGHFIQANSEATKKHVPVLERSKHVEHNKEHNKHL